jgi:hypothetical protein
LPNSEFMVAEVGISAATTANAAEDHVEEVTQTFVAWRSDTMLECSDATTYVNFSSQKDRAHSSLNIDEIVRQDMNAGLAKMHRQLHDERRKASIRYLAGFWPVAVGLVLGLFAPAIKDLLEPFGDWGMAIVFPFVVLCGRPELHLSSSAAASISQFMLYAQFPIEGLIAKIASRGRVTLPAVTTRVACLQILATFLLLLVSGVVGQIVGR